MTEKYEPSPEVLEQGLYVAYAALSTMAVVPIYFGSFASLKKWKVTYMCTAGSTRYH
jgi:minor histocompatibility antigen H13